jgi:hypothetical protein
LVQVAAAEGAGAGAVFLKIWEVEPFWLTKTVRTNPVTLNVAFGSDPKRRTLRVGTGDAASQVSPGSGESEKLID